MTAVRHPGRPRGCRAAGSPATGQGQTGVLWGVPPDRPSASSPSPAVAVWAAAGLLVGPALVAGMLLAGVMARRGARWTWAVPVVVLSAPAAVWLAAGLPARIAGLPDLAPAGLLAALLPVWVTAVPACTVVCAVRDERRARLRGGRAERQAVARAGPAAWASRWRAARRPPLLWADGRVLLGCDSAGLPVRVARPQAHVTVVGASNSGKTTTASVLLGAQVAAGGGFVVLDGKGGHDLPRLAVRLGAQHDRPVRLWSLMSFGDPDLDALRVGWNPVGDGTPTQVKDRIGAAEPQTEPYYRAVGARGLQLAATALDQAGEAVDVAALADLLEDPRKLTRALAAFPDADPAAQHWLKTLKDPELSGLRGIALRLRTLAGCDGGEYLRPRAGGDLQLMESVRQRELVVFSLPQGVYPEVIPAVGRYLMAALNQTAARLEAAGRPTDGMVFVDELSALDGEQLCAGLERGRSVGLRYVLATQSLSNFESAGGPKLLDAALDNAEWLVVHRQAVPDAAERLASVGGTEEAWEHTHKVSGHGAVPFGLDETGDRARRLTDRFRAHPNQIKALRQGEVILITTHPHHHVRTVKIKPLEVD